MKFLIQSILDVFRRLRLANTEKMKMKDSRRKSIIREITLTKTQKKQIDDLFVPSLGRKVPYIWHQYYTAYMGTFDPKYFPESLYIPEFEQFMNPDKSYCRVYSDKNVLSYIMKGVGVKMPEVYCSRQAGMYRDSNYSICSFEKIVEIIKEKKEVFLKPSIDSNSGQGCKLISTYGGGILSQEDLTYLRNLKSDFVVQERIICHKSIRNIYDKSVNTFRIITYRDVENGNNVIRHMPVKISIQAAFYFLFCIFYIQPTFILA